MKRILLLATFLTATFISNALTDEEKYEVVNSIYKKLYEASSDKGIRPKLRFDKYKANQIAYMMIGSDGKPLIGFESKAFDVCEQFGERRDDAIAFILGHEISHHIMKHNWGKEFRSAYSLGELEKDLKTIGISNAIVFETQADENGGILTYMAGFNTSGLAGSLLIKLYEAYKIKPSPKYPSLDERIKIAQTQDSLVQTYIRIYEVANYAMMTRNYELATKCFSWIETKFKSREIYNNYGVALFLQGVEASDADVIKYIYPVEIDLEGKMNPKGAKGMGDDVKVLFEQSIEMFEKAFSSDKSYFTAKLNTACAYSVLGNYRKAKTFAEDVIYDGDKKKDNYTIMNAQLVLAIINDLDENGDKAKAVKIFDKLIAQGHLLAEVNKKLMNDVDISEIKFAEIPLQWMDGSSKEIEKKMDLRQESITGLPNYKISTLRTEIPTELEQELKFGGNNEMLAVNFDDSRLYFVPGNEYLLFHATKPNYKDTLREGIKLGDTKKAVLEKYGSPSSVNTTRQGMILAYPKSRLMILLDHEENVKQLIIWREDSDF